MTAHPGSYRFTWVVTTAIVAAMGGCAKTGTVTGRATVDDKPAAGATMLFSADEHQSVLAIVHDDGTYEAPGVPVGPVKVSVKASPMTSLGRFSPGMPPPKKGKMDPENVLPPVQRSSPFRAVPIRYTDPETSGLTLTVTRGRNEFNIAMTSP